MKKPPINHDPSSDGGGDPSEVETVFRPLDAGLCSGESHGEPVLHVLVLHLTQHLFRFHVIVQELPGVGGGGGEGVSEWVGRVRFGWKSYLAGRSGSFESGEV